MASGIPDFRSPGGLWSRFAPEDYATLEVFRRDPATAWQLYRALGRTLAGKEPSNAHRALARLEAEQRLAGIVTQNVDGLHQRAGSRRVLEVHGDHLQLQCLGCGHLEPVTGTHLESPAVPLCPDCRFPLKPNVVLFGEAVRSLEEIEGLLAQCDLLLVIGTSAQVYPAAGFPVLVRQNGGVIIEFNREPALGREPCSGGGSDYLFEGDLERTLPDFCRQLFTVR